MQKAGVENAIGRMLRGLPLNTDLATVPPERFHAFGAGIQQHRRQVLGLPDASGKSLQAKCSAGIFNPLSRRRGNSRGQL